LATALTKHLKETERQVQRLERVFRELDETPRTKVCRGMAGLLEEGKEILEQDGEGTVIEQC
jgi:ferritin-like metal-binding protein YciE